MCSRTWREDATQDSVRSSKHPLRRPQTCWRWSLLASKFGRGSSTAPEGSSIFYSASPREARTRSTTWRTELFLSRFPLRVKYSLSSRLSFLFYKGLVKNRRGRRSTLLRAASSHWGQSNFWAPRNGGKLSNCGSAGWQVGRRVRVSEGRWRANEIMVG